MTRKRLPSERETTSFEAMQMARKRKRPGWSKAVSDIGGRGGGSLEPGTQWQWLGAQWRGLLLEVPSCPEPPVAP